MITTLSVLCFVLLFSTIWYHGRYIKTNRELTNLRHRYFRLDGKYMELYIKINDARSRLEAVYFAPLCDTMKDSARGEHNADNR